ncbi:FMRFamide receptor-like [Plakobranchus ocellatus]|uniref:FMRFamide receptor-like n=1 Tax=Plakobranchus ocellatus TaxID=259542 RepID=A0AAV3ZJR0_9GAST|nr:FMRFamide receptor-like [Plakobranchus ocellatus]
MTLSALGQHLDNSSNVSSWQAYEYKRSRYLGLRSTQIVLCVLGLVGNAAVILAWTANRRRTPIVGLMTSLACWDLGLLGSFMYFCIRNFNWWYLRRNSMLNPWSGSIFAMGHDAYLYSAVIGFHSFVCMSVFTVLAISVVRYIAVVRPLMVKGICSRKRMKHIVTGIMIFSVLLTICFNFQHFCLSFGLSIKHSHFCLYVARHRRMFSYPSIITIGWLPWIGTIPLSVLLVLQVIQIPKSREVRRGHVPAMVTSGTRRITLYVISMVLLSAMTYPVIFNIFLAMEEIPDWDLNSKEALFLTSDFLYIVNSIGHIFLFCVGGTFFRSLLYTRMRRLCAAKCSRLPGILRQVPAVGRRVTLSKSYELGRKDLERIDAIDDYRCRFQISFSKEVSFSENKLFCSSLNDIEILTSRV